MNNDCEDLLISASNYYKGIGVKKDYKKAIELYQMAVDKGHSCAMYNLGYMYYHGKGVQQNYSKAIELYQMAVDKGLSDAMNYLGLIYYNGQGVQQNYDKAIQYFQMAIDKGHSGAMNNLGIMYYNGQDVQQNYDKAIELLQMAINKSEPNAMNNLGLMYEQINDFNKACHHYYMYYKVNTEYHYKLRRLIDNYNIIWTSSLNQYWFTEDDKLIQMNNISVTLLMISKYRQSSNRHYIKLVLVKGITMMIIKWFAFYMKLLKD
jgi:TPR repeat protein